MCPECHTDLVCPCGSCRKGRVADLYKGVEWVWIGGEVIQCPVCGFSAHADRWMDFEWQDYASRRML
jgi:hypothetical protein